MSKETIDWRGLGQRSKVKVQVTKRSTPTFLRSESTRWNLLKFGGMIGHDPKNNRLVLGVIGSKVKVKVTKRSKTKVTRNRNSTALELGRPRP